MYHIDEETQEWGEFTVTGHTEPKFNLIENKSCGWHWQLGKDSNIRFYPTGKPNAFHRTMQRLLLGIYWHKTE
jgi:hypothetical protein